MASDHELYLQGRHGEWIVGESTPQEYLARWPEGTPLAYIEVEIRKWLERDDRAIQQWQASPPVSPYGRGVCERLAELNRVRREALKLLVAVVPRQEY